LIAGAATAAFRPVDGAPSAAGNASPQQQQTSSLTGSKEAAAIAASGAGTVPVVGSGAPPDQTHIAPTNCSQSLSQSFVFTQTHKQNHVESICDIVTDFKQNIDTIDSCVYCFLMIQLPLRLPLRLLLVRPMRTAATRTM
jgi:hypothetical protein